MPAADGPQWPYGPSYSVIRQSARTSAVGVVETRGTVGVLLIEAIRPRAIYSISK